MAHAILIAAAAEVTFASKSCFVRPKGYSWIWLYELNSTFKACGPYKLKLVGLLALLSCLFDV